MFASADLTLADRVKTVRRALHGAGAGFAQHDIADGLVGAARGGIAIARIEAPELGDGGGVVQAHLPDAEIDGLACANLERRTIGADYDAWREIVHMAGGNERIDAVEPIRAGGQARELELARDAVNADRAAVIGAGFETAL